MDIYVGNFAYNTTEQELKTLFSVHGAVENVYIVTDHYTRQSKCFGYIEMHEKKDAEKAIKMLHGHGIEDRKLVVRKSDPLPCRDPRTSLPN